MGEEVFEGDLCNEKISYSFPDCCNAHVPTLRLRRGNKSGYFIRKWNRFFRERLCRDGRTLVYDLPPLGVSLKPLR